MKQIIIAAISDNLAIGRSNTLLWHISEDLKYFKQNTSGCAVIMGRKTFESIGRPLPKRLNIVISRGFDAPEGVLVAPSLQEAVKMAEEMGPSMGMSSEQVFVIGGGQIYAEAIKSADKMILTHVHTVIEDADTYFPSFDDGTWRVESRSDLKHDIETNYDFEFVVYSKS